MVNIHASVELYYSFTPTANAESWAVEAFWLCMFLSSTKLSEWSPMERRAPAQGFVTRPAYLRSQFRNNTNTVSTLVPLIHLLQVPCTQYAGVTHHRALQTSGQGWADSNTVHGMECSRARSLYWRSLSVGAAA